MRLREHRMANPSKGMREFPAEHSVAAPASYKMFYFFAGSLKVGRGRTYTTE